MNMIKAAFSNSKMLHWQGFSAVMFIQHIITEAIFLRERLKL